MSGSTHNRAILTREFLLKTAYRDPIDISRITGIDRQVIRRYRRANGIYKGTEKAELAKMIDEAHAVADRLQVLYFKIDKLKESIKKKEDQYMEQLSKILNKRRK